MNKGDLKILHVIPAVAPRYGGPSRAIFEMCRPLRARVASILIVTTDADGEDRLPVPTGHDVEYGGVPTIFFPRQWCEAFKYSRPLRRWLERNVGSFDLVHIHAVFSHACLAAARACRGQGVPYIVRPLGTLDPWGMRQKPLRKRLFMRLGVDSMLRGAAAIQYTATGEKMAVEASLGYERGVVIPLGIETAINQESKSTTELSTEHISTGEKPYVLFLSRLHHKKGLELLIEAFVSLARNKEFADWQLVVAGDGDPSYIASLKRKVNEIGGSKHVEFTGWLDGERKSEAFRGAALLALPSYQENFGVCLVEALAYGVPVIVSPQVNLAADIEEAGAGWVANLDVASLKGALRGSLQDATERRRRGLAGQQFAARFGPAEVSTQLMNLYQNVADSQPGNRDLKR